MTPGRMMRSMTAADGYSLDPKGRLIPRPEIPVLPVLSLRDIRLAGGSEIPGQIDIPEHVALPDGRSAIFQALRLAAVQAGDHVLVPDWHCTAMIHPVLALGALPVLYRTGPDLLADMDDIAEKMNKRTRALLVTNFFGFPNRLEELCAFSRKHRMTLIEDCAHSMFGSLGGRTLGSFGDYSISSYRKFLPVPDGASLASAHHKIDLPERVEEGFVSRLRSWASVGSMSVAYGRLPALRLPLRLARSGAARIAAARAKPPAGADEMPPDRWQDPSRLDVARAMALPRSSSRVIARMIHRERLVSRRQSNYRNLVAAIADLGIPEIRPLFPELPDTVVPFMLPLQIENLGRIFPMLEDSALPLQRFGQFLWSDTRQRAGKAALEFSRNGIQIPCHQELSVLELKKIIDILKSAFS